MDDTMTFMNLGGGGGAGSGRLNAQRGGGVDGAGIGRLNAGGVDDSIDERVDDKGRPEGDDFTHEGVGVDDSRRLGVIVYHKGVGLRVDDSTPKGK